LLIGARYKCHVFLAPMFFGTHRPTTGQNQKETQTEGQLYVIKRTYFTHTEAKIDISAEAIMQLYPEVELPRLNNINDCNLALRE
jgi:hypothetical protein